MSPLGSPAPSRTASQATHETFDPNRDVVHQGLLRTDKEYLGHRVCAEFRKYDTHKRGFITAAAFSRALDDLGLRYGQQEVDAIMQYCTITDDGYVHYSDLIRSLQPAPPRASQSQADKAIYPVDQDEYTPSVSVASERRTAPSDYMGTPEIDANRVRVIYARWDRGLLTDEQFKDELWMQLGIRCNEDVVRLLALHGPSRNLSFAKLMHALQIDDACNRRARNPVPPQYISSEFQPPARGSTANPAPASKRNPVTWNDGQGPTPLAYAGIPPESRAEHIHRSLCMFVDGVTPSILFRQQLQQCAVPITQDIDCLIRKHESDNSTQYRDYARIIFRNEAQERDGSAMPPCHAPYAQDSACGSYRGPGGGYFAGGCLPGGGCPPEDGYSSSGGGAVRAPYATTEPMPPMPPQEFMIRRREESNPNSPDSRGFPPRFENPTVHGTQSRKVGDQTNGDIIAWRHLVPEVACADPELLAKAEQQSSAASPNDPDTRLQPMYPGWRTNGDIISWTTKDVTRPHLRQGRFGKRYFGQNTMPGTTPFGTDADVSGGWGGIPDDCPHHEHFH